MRFVPIKTLDQQGVLSLHRVRSLFVRQRTAAINTVRGLLTEFGIVARKGIRRVAELRQRMDKVGNDLLPAEARAAIAEAFDHVDELTERIGAVEDRIIAWHRNSEASQRLASAPGVGPITASAIIASVGGGRQFRSARHFAAWLGLTPRIHASGGKEHIGKISKGGDRYLRVTAGEKMHRRAGVKMHHGAAEQRLVKLAFLFDRLSLLSRPDLGTNGAQRRGWEERSHAHPGLDPGEHGEHRTFRAASTVAG